MVSDQSSDHRLRLPGLVVTPASCPRITFINEPLSPRTAQPRERHLIQLVAVRSLAAWKGAPVRGLADVPPFPANRKVDHPVPVAASNSPLAILATVAELTAR